MLRLARACRISWLIEDANIWIEIIFGKTSHRNVCSIDTGGEECSENAINKYRWKAMASSKLTCWWPKVKWLRDVDCRRSSQLYKFIAERGHAVDVRANYGNFNETNFYSRFLFGWQCDYCNRQFNDGFCLWFGRRWFQFFSSRFTFTLYKKRHVYRTQQVRPSQTRDVKLKLQAFYPLFLSLSAIFIIRIVNKNKYLFCETEFDGKKYRIDCVHGYFDTSDFSSEREEKIKLENLK